MQKTDNNTSAIFFGINRKLFYANVAEIIEITNGELLRKKYYFCA